MREFEINYNKQQDSRDFTNTRLLVMADEVYLDDEKGNVYFYEDGEISAIFKWEDIDYIWS